MLLALQSYSPYWDTWYWCFGFAKKVFLPIIFRIINVNLWNKVNLDTHNNIHSFCSWHYNHVLHIRILDIDASDLQEKLFFPSFYLRLMFISEMRQTWILVIISILFVVGTTIMFPLLRYTILTLWICKKCFSFHHFPYDQCSSVIWDKLGYPW